MIQIFLVRILLLPFSIIYGLLITLRNAIYSLGLLKSTSFNIPIIGVGNLSIGGAGKTPHVEYLIQMLRPYIQLATMSRGYKRTLKGFKIADSGDNALTIGDEPMMYYIKYPDLVVSVSESRSIGIPQLLMSYPDIQCVLLDDSFQHLSVKPGLSILLTEYARPYSDDFLLPSGRLREWPSGASRADVVIVSKCPDELSEIEMYGVANKLDLKNGQKLFFSYYQYLEPYHLFTSQKISLNSISTVVLLSSIANEEYIIKYLESLQIEVVNIAFEDHHYFDERELVTLERTLNDAEGKDKIILTTEKDATRLLLHAEYLNRKNLNIHVLPVVVKLHANKEQEFNQIVKDFLLNFKV